MTNPSAVLITKGLGSNASAMVTGFFSLVTVTVGPLPPTPAPSGGGGGTVLIPYPEELRKRKRLVTVTFKIGKDKYVKREYIVDIDRADQIVSIMNFTTNVQRGASKVFKVSVDSIKKIPSSIRAVVSNFSKANVSVGNVSPTTNDEDKDSNK